MASMAIEEGLPEGACESVVGEPPRNGIFRTPRGLPGVTAEPAFVQ
jgi:hypothetical protein